MLHARFLGVPRMIIVDVEVAEDIKGCAAGGGVLEGSGKRCLFAVGGAVDDPNGEGWMEMTVQRIAEMHDEFESTACHEDAGGPDLVALGDNSGDSPLRAAGGTRPGVQVVNLGVREKARP